MDVKDTQQSLQQFGNLSNLEEGENSYFILNFQVCLMSLLFH